MGNNSHVECWYTRRCIQNDDSAIKPKQTRINQNFLFFFQDKSGNSCSASPIICKVKMIHYILKKVKRNMAYIKDLKKYFISCICTTFLNIQHTFHKNI